MDWEARRSPSGTSELKGVLQARNDKSPSKESVLIFFNTMVRKSQKLEKSAVVILTKRLLKGLRELRVMRRVYG